MQRELQFRNYSPKTISSYLTALNVLSNYFGISPDKITNDQLKNYLQKRALQDEASPSTINQVISAFKILQVDILGNDWGNFRVKRAKRKKLLPVVISKEEIAELITVTKNLKHKSILSLTYSSGLRKSEVRHIKLADIDSKRMQVKVSQGKGKKDRYTLLSMTTLELLREYYIKYKPTDYLFPGWDQTAPISETTINVVFKRAVQLAGIKKKVYFHCLRHSFATHLLEQGTNLKIIQQLMGHTSFKTTSIYLHVAMIDAVSVTSPGDTLNFCYDDEL